MTKRHVSRLGLGVLAALILGWLVATDASNTPSHVIESTKVAARTVHGAAASSPSSDMSLRTLLPREQLIAKTQQELPTVDLFASRSWVPAVPLPPPPPPPPAPPALRAPTLAPVPTGPQFTYLGKRRDEQGWQVYLGRGDAALIVREGDSLEGGFKVESIQPPVMTLVQAGFDGRTQITIGSWD